LFRFRKDFYCLGLAEAKSLGGTVLLHIFKYGTERKKIDLIKILDSRFNILVILAGLCFSKFGRRRNNDKNVALLSFF
jgi:hypothetical protein